MKKASVHVQNMLIMPMHFRHINAATGGETNRAAKMGLAEAHSFDEIWQLRDGELLPLQEDEE
ncbi:hypothetical protein [uncultured Desulfovibrio sp.]|uniref:hypothetical protein n=1 Tax=uncultured Desulfovibrio sp. TaxID=167968 RepID=UPI0025D8FECE|nr:hypothetical protein [uncultured Desulfovibrio sp.]